MNIGPGYDEVLRALNSSGTPLTMAQLKQEVEYLSGEGQLYTTSDDMHYRPTDC